MQSREIFVEEPLIFPDRCACCGEQTDYLRRIDANDAGSAVRYSVLFAINIPIVRGIVQRVYTNSRRLVEVTMCKRCQRRHYGLATSTLTIIVFHLIFLGLTFYCFANSKTAPGLLFLLGIAICSAAIAIIETQRDRDPLPVTVSCVDGGYIYTFHPSSFYYDAELVD